MKDVIDIANFTRFWADGVRLSGVIEKIADGVICINASGQIEMFNPVAERLFGYTSSEVIGQNISILMTDDVGKKHDSYLKRYNETREPHIIAQGREVLGKHRDGSVFPIYLSVGEVQVSGIKGFIGIIRDLSEQKAADLKLSRAGEFLQAIIDSMSSMLIGIDIYGIITHWNEAAAKNFGMDVSEAIGSSFTKLLPFLGIISEDVTQAIEKSVPIKREQILVVIRGKSLYADLMIFPLNRNFGGAVVRLDDVTERVRMQEIMVHTEKMLSINGLAAGMAHEINNPLSVISVGCQNVRRRLSLELAKNKDIAERFNLNINQMQEYFQAQDIFTLLSKTNDAADRASNIIQKTLAYSRHNISSFIQVRLKELIDSALDFAKHDYDLQESYDFCHIKIQRYGNEDIKIICDRTAIQQVLLNLLRNSAQAMKGLGKAEIPQIDLRVSMDSNWVQIEIADNGPGMSSDVAKRIFEKFFTTKAVGSGTGLGLSVAHFIITQQHQGTIDLITSPGQGTKFVIRLPKDGGSHARSNFNRG